METGWKKEVHGYSMYKLVNKLKSLKHALSQMSWEKGNVFDKVDKCREKLRKIQSKMDKDPHSSKLKLKVFKLLKNTMKQ